MRTVLQDDVGMLVFDLSQELDRRLYIAYLEQPRPSLHPSAIPVVDQCIAQVQQIQPTFPGYTVFTQ